MATTNKTNDSNEVPFFRPSFGGQRCKCHCNRPARSQRVSASSMHARPQSGRIRLDAGRASGLHQQSYPVSVLVQRIRPARHVLPIAPLLRTRHSRVITDRVSLTLTRSAINIFFASTGMSEIECRHFFHNAQISPRGPHRRKPLAR